MQITPHSGFAGDAEMSTVAAPCWIAEEEALMRRIGEIDLLQSIYEFLTSHTPVDPGFELVYKLCPRRGRYRSQGMRFRLGPTRLYVPTRNDRDSAVHHGCAHLLSSGDAFKNRYVSASETYIAKDGRKYSGTELVEMYGVVIGLDARSAIRRYLEDCAEVDALTFDQIMGLVDVYRLPRGAVTEIYADRGLDVRVARRAGRNGIKLVVKEKK